MPMKLDLPNFADEIKQLLGDSDKLPPVDSWHPQRSGEVDIQIDAQGQWRFQGDVMQREAIVRLFSSILRKDDDGYWLVTPAEKMKIQVEDVPFIVRLMDTEGEGAQRTVYLSTNVADHFKLDAEHPLWLAQGPHGDDIPYVRVRGGLNARLARPVYYDLVKYVEQHPDTGESGLWSGGQFFSLLSA